MGKNLNLNEKNQAEVHFDFLLLDCLCLVFAFFISYASYLNRSITNLNNIWTNAIILLIFIDLVVSLLTSPYSNVFNQPGYMISIRSIKQTVYMFTLTCVVFYMLKLGEDYSRATLLITFILYTFFTIMAKVSLRTCRLYKLSCNGRKNKSAMIVITDRYVSRRFCEDLLVGDRALYYIKAIQYIGNDNIEAQELKALGIEILSPDDNIKNYVLSNNVQEIYFATELKYTDTEEVANLVKSGVRVFVDLNDIIGFTADEQRIINLGVYKTLELGNHSLTAQQNVYVKCKRAIDILAGIVGCFITLILGLVIKIIYLCNGDYAPILFKQNRIGKNGQTIEIYKFRTMVPDAEEQLEEILKDPSRRREWDTHQKLIDDPRLTSIGKILRRSSIDEFPQFINVLNGTMSLIGPRPLIPDELEKHQGIKIYNTVKPGITGWWACNGRSDIKYNERLELEYYYVKNVCFELDVLVMIRTLKTVILKQGAA